MLHWLFSKTPSLLGGSTWLQAILLGAVAIAAVILLVQQIRQCMRFAMMDDECSSSFTAAPAAQSAVNRRRWQQRQTRASRNSHLYRRAS